MSGKQLQNNVSTRDQIIMAADRLFYEHGFEYTSFADIANEVNLSRGNFYYHFKSKDEILNAVIAARLEATRRMLKQWEADSEEPLDRVRSFIHILIVNGSKIKRFGCPVGTLNAELAKLNHRSKDNATQLFELFRNWLRRQFCQLGCRQKSNQFAMHLLARSQGVASLANAYGNDKFVRSEVRQMCQWLDSIVADCA